MKKNNVVFVVIIAVLTVVAIISGIVSGVVKSGVNKTESATSTEVVNEPVRSGKTLDELLERYEYSEVDKNDLVKAPIDMGDDASALYNELPEIDKYPLVVEGNGGIDIEVFTSGEKAGKDTDGWLIDVANSFNASGVVTSGGQLVTMSVRSVSSGLGADYCISEKYLPDLWTPSNEIFGEYAIASGADIELYKERLVGNTAGVLVKKDSKIPSLTSLIDKVISGNLNFGYTNPQTSGAGVNLLIELLKTFGDGNIESDNAVDTFAKFNNNIPFISYTTQQMRDSAKGGSLDCMVSEYQAYINDESLVAEYDFVPYGMRHDNPIYIVDKGSKSADEMEAIEAVVGYMLSGAMQDIATEYGFNANDDYISSYDTTGSEVMKALSIYKTKKDSGRDVIAVFVTDCSGSMDGSPILEVKESLSNGMKYINENNMVGLVSYASDVTIEVPIAKFDLTQKSYFQGALNNLQAVGGTSSYEAICVGLKMIRDAKADNPNAKCMLFLLSDGHANGDFDLKDIEYAVTEEKVPIYTIGYTSDADAEELGKVSSINEATSISADTDDIVYQIKSLFNAQL